MTQRKPYPEAVATSRGWAHHLTGELLVSIRGLENAVPYYKANAGENSFKAPSSFNPSEVFVISPPQPETTVETEFGFSAPVSESTQNATDAVAPEVVAPQKVDEKPVAETPPAPKKRGRKSNAEKAAEAAKAGKEAA